jgi:hypothetical protein
MGVHGRIRNLQAPNDQEGQYRKVDILPEFIAV